MPRLFVALDLPDALAGAFSDLRADAPDAPSLSYTDPEDAHVTVKFLGDTPEDDVDEVVAALERAVDDADAGPFPVEVAGLGAFPDEEYIRVVWVGIDEGGEELARLHEAVERETVALGFDPEEHEFTPHVTLARMSDARGKEDVRRFLRGTDPELGRFEAGELRLKASELGPDGPTYRTVARFPL